MRQLFYYMQLNKLKYGFVSSARQTLFVWVVSARVGSRIEIAGPFWVGEPEYLRNFAYFLSEARDLARLNWRLTKWEGDAVDSWALDAMEMLTL